MVTRSSLALVVGAVVAALAVNLARRSPPQQPSSAAEARAQGKPRSRLFIASALELYRVDADVIAPLELKLDPTLDLGQVPVPSPDHARFAYTEENEVAVVDVATKRSERVTTVGVPANDEWAAIEAVPLAWSRSGERVLYELAHGDRVNEHGHDRKIRPAEYGFYTLQVATRKTTRVSGDGEFLSWLPDESVLVMPRDKAQTGGAPLRLAGGRLDPLTADATLDGRFVRHQTDLTSDGRFWLASVATPGDDLRTRVVAVDLAAGTTRVILPNGESGIAHQFPHFSPSGAHASVVLQDYRGRDEKSEAPPPCTLLVDGARVYPPESTNTLIANAQFLDEDSLVVALADRVIKLDWRTRVVRTTVTRAAPSL